MRTRITLAFVATLALALFLASLASILLVRHASSANAQTRILNEAKAIQANPHLATVPGVLPLVHRVAGIKRESIIVINSAGKISTKTPLDLPPSVLGPMRLLRGKSVSGAHNHLAFAAVPLFSTSATKGLPAETVALVLESTENFSVANVLYFAIAGFISLVVAVAFSIEISRRISRHVTAAADAAGRIAKGDFSARMDVPGRGYPELVELQDSLNRMARDLERSREGERDFLLSISHELRTPLTSIRGYAEAIAEGALSSPATGARVVMAESARLERLIDDLLSMARLSAQQFAFRVETCDLSSAVIHAAEALRYEFEECGVELRLSPPGRPLVGITDEDRLCQIVANLVENALKYASRAVDVTVREDVIDQLVVEVGDDGPGIDPADQPRVFERLFTSDRHVARRVGTGLGLAIVAELTQALGGSIEITSPRSSAGGTMFTLRMPLGVRAATVPVP